ncbi:type II toxin-antitoxin system RelE/ParE family toxin [Xenorhabdus bovienii]|uniref:Uncharacterized protein n=4 Tax=Xenorhabdus bovienii TaxID=40576 RepID=A0A077P5F8_XENBV|nr:type II toxin-antitoxin system RelE/ParE family toxin [Xenorhabdus bovienii]MCG3461108.1 type II toxin-antitoxin system RelE/ParE family toxin [Xenorhabdus bovienii]MCP9267674.1 type II toxin-antitoxin system RelE/ParE family toxin [Xenorhabdus bovienii subsp. africana]MDE9446056.1 type II toxin-antitoxin system RelE/ParE family toxin [Xenorhabdus bovienii]MDE9465394.1 type II toxin-antitoxin system RelE/ParE family toxin [Xenorhabdus bovienii]MDE9498439.1 type II toxin-antitoxin system Rel
MWELITSDLFDEWFKKQDDSLQETLLAAMINLQRYGPMLGRPYVDTLEGSSYPNMKELRVQYGGNPIRALFAFDPKRCAVIFCAGNKKGENEKRFYENMIKIADAEFKKHLENLEG